GEFGVMLPNSHVDQAREVVQRIVTSDNECTFLWHGHPYHVGASAGITQNNQYNCVRNVVMSQADVACYSAKHAGRGQYHVYQEVQM
uniref:diguanylate cyclase domain-containing protein n=1 Tax=Pantoea sp. CTOTU50773 TaxID=2953853 RepID=UPI0028B108DA